MQDVKIGKPYFSYFQFILRKTKNFFEKFGLWQKTFLKLKMESCWNVNFLYTDLIKDESNKMKFFQKFYFSANDCLL